MENTRKPPYLHVKHKNTRKAGTKMVENTLFLRSTTYYKYFRGWMRTSDFRFFRVPEQSLNVLTVIICIQCLFRRKVTKPTV